MKETTPTNIFFAFCHRLTYKFAQDPFFKKGQKEKCVLQGATFTKWEAYKNSAK
jgi:hypothetical protein